MWMKDAWSLSACGSEWYYNDHLKMVYSGSSLGTNIMDECNGNLLISGFSLNLISLDNVYISCWRDKEFLHVISTDKQTIWWLMKRDSFSRNITIGSVYKHICQRQVVIAESVFTGKHYTADLWPFISHHTLEGTIASKQVL